MESEKKKKKKVIHTRVSEPLEQALKDRAEEMGVSVSNLVRNIMLNTFDLVEGVVADSVRVADSAMGHNLTGGRQRATEPAAAAAGAAAPAAGEVLGWQELVLNLNAICESCNEILPRGARAAIGFMSGPGKKPIICTACLEAVTGPAQEGQRLGKDEA